METQLTECSEAPPDREAQPNEHSDALQARILQCLTTEHFVLQTGRSMTVADASSRSILFLSTISSTLIVLAFIGQHITPRGSILPLCPRAVPLARVSRPGDL